MNDAMKQFTIMGGTHIAALAGLVLLGYLIIHYGNKNRDKNMAHGNEASAMSKLLAFLCLAGVLMSFCFSLYSYQEHSWYEYLPFHFCDVMAFVCAYALLARSRKATAIAFFGVVCASAQALITPNITDDFPHPVYFSFFFSHGIIFICAIYFMLVLKWRPGRYEFINAQIFGILYLIVIHPVNILLSTNFGFTRYIPESGSILSILGPWPWYMFVMQIPAFLFMGLLNYVFYQPRDNFR